MFFYCLKYDLVMIYKETIIYLLCIKINYIAYYFLGEIMKINIFEERFIDVLNILAVKSYLKRIDKYEVKNDVLKLFIMIDLTYLDHNMTENFKTLKQPCEVVLKDEMNVLDVNLIDLELCAVENKGVNIKYNIDIDYDMKEVLDNQFDENKFLGNEEPMEIPVNNSNAEKLEYNKEYQLEESIDNDKKENESELIQEEYQEMLGNIIQKREDNKEIIEVVHNDEDSFLSLFDSFSSNYLKITKLYVHDKDEVMSKFNLQEEEFEKCFNKETNVLTLRSYD